jgi:RND superfamily putative drug exporter
VVFARLLFMLRFLVVTAVVVAAVAAWKYLPGTSTLPRSNIGGLLPSGTEAVRAETEAQRLFGSGLLPRITVVERDPDGLSRAAQRHIVALAVRLDRGELPSFPSGSRAVPYLNSLRALPGSRESSTSAITYLGFPPTASAVAQRNLADRYARAASVPGARAHVTGFLPGSLAQTDAIDHDLLWVELATVLAVGVIVGVSLRSLLAPVLTLGAAAVAYFIAVGLVSFVGESRGVAVSSEAEPIMVVLLLGVMTDYSVFFLSSMRDRLRSGAPPKDAVQRATAQVAPIVVMAGLLVAASLATLWLASIDFVQMLGPATAIVVLVGATISIVAIPAVAGFLGGALFWPGIRRLQRDDAWWERAGAASRRGIAQATSRWWLAIPLLLVTGGVLALASSGILQTRLALTPIRGAPAGSAPAVGEREAQRGFAAGMIAPTELIVRAPQIADRQEAVRELTQEISRQPEVGAVVGAGLVPLPGRLRLAFESRGGDAIRYFVALRHEPYSSAAIADLARLQSAMPRLLHRGDLSDATALYAGDTALAQETVRRVEHDLLEVGLAAIAVNLVLLGVFLRSIVASFLLVVSSVAGILATIGLTTLVFRELFHVPDLTYFVPLSVGVLLLSFGTDYNLFVVARIWQEAERMEPPQAIRAAVPRASRAISIAGIALAASFVMLAIVPILPFREFAVAVALGIVIDTFVIRTIFVPSLLAAFGHLSWWPRDARRRAVPRGEQAGSP